MEPSLKLNCSFCPKPIKTQIEVKLLQFEVINLQLDLIKSVLDNMPLNWIPAIVLCSENTCVYHNESRLISAVFMAN